MDVEFQDWEIIHSVPASDSEPLIPAGNANGLDEVGSETGGLIQPNYFCIDSQTRYMSNFSGNEEGSEESDNPSWIDPGSENHFTMDHSGEFWSDSGSERSKFGESESKNEGIRGEIWSDTVKYEENNRFSAGQNSHGSVEGKQENGNVEGEHKRRSILWWKVPIELVKYCAFRGVSPVWTFSIAAAVMGFVILSRRLYNMKKKTKPLQLKVTLDDKKVSQFMSRAARLNEAFSIVKRVPLNRPQLPAAGATLWPVMSLR